jgi:programmed cell death 6-interacting protein
MAALTSMLGQNKSTSQSCYSMLASVEQMLAKEETEDEACRMQYGSQWERPKSSVLSASLREEVERYYQLLKEAKSSDETVGAEIESNKAIIQQLGLSRQDLDATLPDNSKSSSVDTNALSHLLVRMGTLIQQRGETLKKLKELSNNDNMVAILMQTGGQEHDEIFEKEIEKYSPLTQQIDTTIQQQGQYRDQIVVENDKFIAARDTDQATKDREVIIRKLDAAVNSFEKLSSQLLEGNNFYKDLIARVQQLQQTTVDHCSPAH